MKRKLYDFPAKIKYSVNELSKTILRLKIEVIRPLVEEANFKMLHSKYATYIDLDILEAINEVFTLTKANHRIPNKTMALGTNKNSHVTHRKIHEETVAVISGEIARRLGLNDKLAQLIGDFHDIGHTFDGHGGEHIVSMILQSLGIGYAVHNALGVEILVDKENAIKKVKEKVKEIKKRKNPNISDDEIQKLYGEVEKSVIYVLDGILSHNGEGTNREIRPNYNKSILDFWHDYQWCFIKKGYDRTINPMTSEGAVMKFSDLIAYVVSDFLDGCRYGYIDINNLPPEYIDAFSRFGVKKEFIDSLLANKSIPKDTVKDKIGDEIREVLVNDLVENSFGKDIICFSSEMVDAMYNLRDVNYRKVILKYHENEPDTVTYQEVKELSCIFVEAIIQQGWLSLFPEGYEEKNGEVIPKDSGKLKVTKRNESLNFKTIQYNTYLRKIKHSISRMTPKEMARQMYIIDKALTESISEEIRLAKYLVDPNFGNEYDQKMLESIQKSEELNLKWNRIQRFAKDIKLNNGNLDVSEVMSEIKLTIPESEERLRNKIIKMYPNSTQEVISSKFKELYYTERLLTYEELLANTLVSKYIRGASNRYIKEMVDAFGIEGVSDIAKRTAALFETMAAQAEEQKKPENPEGYKGFGLE